MSSTVLRLCTAGHVDDGKSTLIGRLLHDSRAVYEDQLRSVERASRGRVAGPIDFSLFTDGLKAEREQGITIDVAYRYFATARRTFILADTPGHEQYTRNMATGASTAEVAILLVDVRHGLREQSLRHARIARLLGVSSFVLAVNKMDLAGYREEPFAAVCRQFETEFPDAQVQGIPLSALLGDNVVSRSSRTPWFDGPPLLEHLETVRPPAAATEAPFRLPVQLVLRTGDGFRGYAGRIASGEIRVGESVTVCPSNHPATVARILTFQGDLRRASAPMSVVVVLADDVDVGRGDLLAHTPPLVATRFQATVVWMDERPLEPRRLYLLKHGTRWVLAQSDRPLALNEIAAVTIDATRPLPLDLYELNRRTGRFILVDPDTNFTSGAGMITAGLPGHRARASALPAAVRLASVARAAASETDAVEAVNRALAEMLT